MTRAEFDVWIEQHYEELLKVACRRVDPTVAEDLLQTAVLGMLQSEVLARVDQPGEIGAWPWAVAFVTQAIANKARGRERQKEALRTQKIIHRAGASLGWKQPKRVE